MLCGEIHVGEFRALQIYVREWLMKRVVLVIIVVSLIAAASRNSMEAAEQATAGGSDVQIALVSPADVNWGPAPMVVPAGAKRR